jgi:hypothetical protein
MTDFFFAYGPQIIEELEDRLPNQMEDILSRVKSSLTAPTSSDMISLPHIISVEEPSHSQEPEEDWDEVAVMNDLIFDDTGEGVGVEGDLDVEEA